METSEDLDAELKKLRTEISELRNMINYLVSYIIIEEDDDDEYECFPVPKESDVYDILDSFAS